jgi:dUTP diphosphatase
LARCRSAELDDSLPTHVVGRDEAVESRSGGQAGRRTTDYADAREDLNERTELRDGSAHRARLRERADLKVGGLEESVTRINQMDFAFNKSFRYGPPLALVCGVQTVRVAIQPLSSLVELPHYATSGAAGLDLPAAIDEPLPLPSGAFVLVPCGFAIALPTGFEAQVRPRSGLASKHGVTVLNAPGTIDSDYRGEVKVLLINHGRDLFTVTTGMRIAQLVISPVVRVEWDETPSLADTVRAAGGFGHTGQ